MTKLLYIPSGTFLRKLGVDKDEPNCRMEEILFLLDHIRNNKECNTGWADLFEVTLPISIEEVEVIE